MGTPAKTPRQLTPQQKLFARWISSGVFGAAVLLGILLCYYAYVNVSGGEGNRATGILAWLLSNQKNVFSEIGMVFAALPGLAVSACVQKEGTLSRFGLAIACSLILTFVLAFAAKLILVPGQDSPESQDVAVLAVSGAQQLQGFALTYLSVLFGLKIYGTAKS